MVGPALPAVPNPVTAQVQDVDRIDAPREMDNAGRRPDPARRDNTERLDPLLEAAPQRCEGLEPRDYEGCFVSIRRNFAEMWPGACCGRAGAQSRQGKSKAKKFVDLHASGFSL